MADYNIPAATAPEGEPYKDPDGYYSLEQLKRQYWDYLGIKTPEINEAKEARRYYHGAQWSDKELKALKRRRQPPVVSNRIVRKVDAVTHHRRLPAPLQRLQFLVAPLRAVIVAPRLLRLVDFRRLDAEIVPILPLQLLQGII